VRYSVIVYALFDDDFYNYVKINACSQVIYSFIRTINKGNITAR